MKNTKLFYAIGIVALVAAVAIAGHYADPLALHGAAIAGTKMMLGATVYTKYGDAVKDPAATKPAVSVDAEGAVRCAYSNVAVAADTDVASVHILARLPSNARILPSSIIYTAALTGITSYSVGLGVNGAIVNGKTAVLASAVDIHLAGSFVPGVAQAAGAKGKKLWDLAGYTSDPGGMIDVIGTVNAGASAAGAIESFIVFAKG